MRPGESENFQMPSLVSPVLGMAFLSLSVPRGKWPFLSFVFALALLTRNRNKASS